MKFFRPSWLNVLLPLCLIALSFAPDDNSFVNGIVLRMFLFTPLSLPIRPLIHHWGLVYSDKPMFLTPEAARLTALCWAPVLYLLVPIVVWGIRRQNEIDSRPGRNF
jgi:hypothetical protein